jgi:hypothetical protein
LPDQVTTKKHGVLEMSGVMLGPKGLGICKKQFLRLRAEQLEGFRQKT